MIFPIGYNKNYTGYFSYSCHVVYRKLSNTYIRNSLRMRLKSWRYIVSGDNPHHLFLCCHNSRCTETIVNERQIYEDLKFIKRVNKRLQKRLKTLKINFIYFQYLTIILLSGRKSRWKSRKTCCATFCLSV